MTVKSKITVAVGKEPNKATRVFFWHDDESIMEGFGNRVARPLDLYKTFLPNVAKALGLPEDTRFRWNRYAGCKMCPCSPGFICRESVGKEVHVNLSGTPKTNARPKDELHAASRTDQLMRQLMAEANFAKKH